MKTAEEHIKEHCNTEYHGTTGELMVRSSESAVIIAMESYASEIASKQREADLSTISDEPYHKELQEMVNAIRENINNTPLVTKTDK